MRSLFAVAIVALGLNLMTSEAHAVTIGLTQGASPNGFTVDSKDIGNGLWRVDIHVNDAEHPPGTGYSGRCRVTIKLKGRGELEPKSVTLRSGNGTVNPKGILINVDPSVVGNLDVILNC